MKVSLCYTAEGSTGHEIVTKLFFDKRDSRCMVRSTTDFAIAGPVGSAFRRDRLSRRVWVADAMPSDARETFVSVGFEEFSDLPGRP